MQRSDFFRKKRDEAFKKAWDAASDHNPKEAEKLIEKHRKLCEEMREAIKQEISSIKPK